MSGPHHLPPLAAAEFADFFRAVHGVAPFPWQARLLREVLATGWPDLCDLPPATGKTAVIDVAVFALALGLGERPRRMPLRVAFVVDRRLVVDAAHGRARHLAACLRAALTATPAASVLARVAMRLATQGGASLPLQVAVLRGGLPQERAWADSARQPTVLLSTVDQVGSRLLFRGYGVSPLLAPVQAGLLGEDCLLVLDEAHLSTAFAGTLRAIAGLRRRATHPLGLPFAAVTLSATPAPPAAGARRFVLDRDPAGPDRAGAPVLHRRLAARKTVRLDCAPAPAGKIGLAAQAKLFVAKARSCAADPAVRVVGIVVNRVRLAREIHEQLARQVGAVGLDPTAGGSLLLTGRCRPWDRDRLLGLHPPADTAPEAPLLDRLRCGRDRAAQAEHRPLFVVGTQAIEAGADLDLDALVSETAPWSSLQQRLGRLDRAGERGESTAWILCSFRLPSADPAAQDRLYGAAHWATRRWLWELAGAPGDAPTAPPQALELGVDGQAALGPPPPETALVTAEAPALSPGILGLFAQTAPRPHPDPDPALWLHGPARGPAEVQLVWRADTPATDDPAAWATYAAVLAMVPPVPAEVLALPLGTARAWLARRPADSADLEAAPVEEARAADTPAPPVFVWRGAEASGLVALAELRPGDTVILPAARGGCDRFGWVPTLTSDPAPVADIAEPAARQARGQAVRRLHPGLLAPETWQRVRAVLADASTDDAAALLRELRQVPELGLEELGPNPRLLPYAGPEGGWAAGVVLLGRPAGRPGMEDAAPEPILLAAHGAAVGRMAAEAGAAVGLSAERVADLARAGEGHDLGKAEPRFQALLRGTDLLAALGRPPLARSVHPPRSAAADRARRARVGLPPGLRHEAWSVMLLRDAALLREAADPELVLWLVGTHHGRGRPFWAPVADPAPPLPRFGVAVPTARGSVTLRADTRQDLHQLAAGWPARFDPLMARYGVWGLAYLEAVLRLADGQRAQQEARGVAVTPEPELQPG